MIRFLLFALSATTLSAATFTIEGAVARAVKSNPDLAAARWSIEQARGRLIQSGRPENPALEAELKPSVRGREGSFSIGYVQKYPRTHRLHLERAVSQAEMAAAEAEVRNAERLLRADVRTAATRLLAVKAQRALVEDHRKNSAALAAEAEQTAKKGEGSALDAAHYELEVQRRSLEMLNADAEAAALSAELRPLLGLKTTESLTISGELAAPDAGGGKANPQNRADYQAAVAKENAARTGVEVARAGRKEDASYGFFYEHENAEDEGYGLRKEDFIGFKFSLPLPFWSKNEGKIHEAEATAARARDERAALALKIHAEAAAARAEMAAAAKIVAQTSGPLIAKAKELEGRHEAANKLGQAPLSDVLRAREMRFELEEARLHALRDYHLARARLLAAEGR
jgi:cobalt-zinc-cadmium efflux system outer membrane protein